MTLSILWLFAFIIFILIACLQSRNRLLVYDISLVISLSCLGIIYIVDKYLLDLRVATLLASVFNNMFKGIFSGHDLSTTDLSILIWAFTLFIIFVCIYILLHVLFKYIIVGRNPLLPYKRKDYFTHVLLSGSFIICGFVISTFVFTFITPISNIEMGFMEPVFTYFYGGLKI